MRFIDKHVINPAIEPEKDPLGHVRVFKKGLCFGDQIIEIQNAALDFLCFIGFDKRLRESKKRFRFFHRIDAVQKIKRFRSAVHPGVDVVDDAGQSLNRAFVS